MFVPCYYGDEIRWVNSKAINEIRLDFDVAEKMTYTIEFTMSNNLVYVYYRKHEGKSFERAKAVMLELIKQFNNESH